MTSSRGKEAAAQKDPSLHIFNGDGFDIAYARVGDDTDKPVIIWAHGWGQDHRALLPLVRSLAALGQNIVIDLPGFGQSPCPFDMADTSWGSREYADAMADFIRAVGSGKPVIWIGHSLGCRVGTQLGAHYPDMISAMAFIAGAGLKRQRTIIQRCILRTKIVVFKLGKLLKRIPAIASLMRGH